MGTKRSAVKVKCVTAQMVWVEHPAASRWEIRYPDLELPIKGLRKVPFGELHLVFYTPLGVYVWLHDGTTAVDVVEGDDIERTDDTHEIILAGEPGKTGWKQQLLKNIIPALQASNCRLLGVISFDNDALVDPHENRRLLETPPLETPPLETPPGVLGGYPTSTVVRRRMLAAAIRTPSASHAHGGRCERALEGLACAEDDSERWTAAAQSSLKDWLLLSPWTDSFKACYGSLAVLLARRLQQMRFGAGAALSQVHQTPPPSPLPSPSPST